jgi:putative membrane protein
MNALMLDAVLASVHHLFVFSLVAVLFAELVLASSPPDAARLRQLGRLDSAYGLLSMGIIAAGFLRAAYGAKGWSFYAHNPVFWTKIGIFVAVGLLSAVPTVRLVRWRKAGVVPDAAAMRSTRQWMVAEVSLVAAIPVIAVLMARGVGH